MSDAVEKAVAVMDRLRSPGGCPWDASQTHQSLARYLIEETYETIEAIETDNMALLREELGDLLLQVLFHARLAEELPPDERFSINDVAEDLVAKLVRRHPHVFGLTDVADANEVNENWERLKIAEKGRTSAVDGVPLSQLLATVPGITDQQGLQDALSKANVTVDVNPRYGKWDSTQLALNSDLASNLPPYLKASSESPSPTATPTG